MKIGFGFLGTTLDKGFGPGRWERWRPTVDLLRHEDFAFDQFNLLYSISHTRLAEVILEDLKLISPQTEVFPVQLGFQDPWDFEEVFTKLFDYLDSYPFEPEQSEYFFHITTGTHVTQICSFLLTESHHFPGKLIQVHPSWGKDSEPGRYTVIDLDLSRFDEINQRFEKKREEAYEFLKAGIATRNSRFNLQIELIDKVSRLSTEPLLLMGPTGVGKSALARRIYELKKKRQNLKGELMELNCATVRGDSSMSALFGHVKGAFTGAFDKRDGLLKKAHQGVLFLDEVSELGLDEQSILLKAIEDKVFFPLGSDRATHSDFQLIAGSNQDLRLQVQKGLFREDLLARINLWTFQLPSLKERKEDIEPNIDHELVRMSRSLGSNLRFNKEAKQHYLEFALSEGASWDSNFRDLNASITRMATLSESGVITRSLVIQEIERLRFNWASNKEPQNSFAKACIDEFSNCSWEELDRFEQIQLQGVLDLVCNSQSLKEAGAALFDQTRQKNQKFNDSDRIRKYLLKYGLSFQGLKEFYYQQSSPNQ